MHHDSCHHRGMDIVMVAVGSCLREGKAKGASRSQRPRIERAFDSGDRMGDCIIVRPDHLRTRLHREGRWTESKVRDRDAVASAGRGRGRSIGRSGGRGTGGSSRRSGGRSTGGSSCGRAHEMRNEVVEELVRDDMGGNCNILSSACLRLSRPRGRWSKTHSRTVSQRAS